VSEIARLTGIEKGNAHRILKTLESVGYVSQHGETKKYRGEAEVLALARTALGGMDIITIARQSMTAISEETGESVHLAQRTKRGGVYVAQKRQPGRITIETEIGAHPIIHATATGKALTAFDEFSQIEDLIQNPMTAFTQKTITSVAEFQADLARVRERGYAIDDEELTPDVRCVAAPIFDFFGAVIGCVGISGPASRMSDERLGVMGSRIRDAADAITQKLGGRPPQRVDTPPSPLLKTERNQI
jgi:IclR family acetate operon transcriptional repressor